VAQSKSADLMIDALETALLDDMPEVRQACIWPLAWMRHERTPTILRKTYNLEQNSAVKAEIVHITTSLMAENAGADAEALAVSEAILQDALKSGDELVRAAAEAVIKNREEAAAVRKSSS
jgi:hypothetical protein